MKLFRLTEAINQQLQRAARAVLGRDTSPRVPLTEEDRRYLTSPYDDTKPLPPGAAAQLSGINPELIELQRAYAALGLPVVQHSVWAASQVSQHLDLRYFRGDSLFVWHYRELPRATRLKFFIYLKYLLERDRAGLLQQLTEDGAFGCWTFHFPGHNCVSRDLLDSVNELHYLDRQLNLSQQPRLRVLDIGAGYGRLAHRMTQAWSNVADYCCVDAVPESTFLSNYYLDYRSASRARIVRLDRIASELKPGQFDLAMNIHSFSECTRTAVEWWVGQLQRLEVNRVFIVPNEPEGFLSKEANGQRLDLLPVLEKAGYHLRHREPVFDDSAVRELMGVSDHHHLFERR